MENEIKKKKDKEAQIKKIESEINSLKSDINKNMDILHTQEEYKTFLGQLGSQSQHFQVKNAEKEAIKQQMMEDWIRVHKDDTSEDHIIFRADDEQANSDFDDGQAGQAKSRMNFNKMNPEQRRQNMT